MPFLVTRVQVGSTALIFAAHNGHAPVVQALLDSGAAVDLVNQVRKLSECIAVECKQSLNEYMSMVECQYVTLQS